MQTRKNICTLFISAAMLFGTQAIAQTASFQSTGAYRINNSNGILDLGPQNSSWCHIIADPTNANTTQKFYFNRPLVVNGGIISSYNGGDLFLSIGSGTLTTPKIIVKNSTGYVGIGASNPQYQLDVAGNIGINDNALYLRGDVWHGLKYGGNGFAGVSIDGPVLWGHNSGALGYYNTSPTDQHIALFWNSAGNIGIGTTSPGSFKLAVEGKIGAREFVVTNANPWPDYVFEKTYTLMPLSQLKQYIVNNKHLPNVPSAQEIKTNNGFDLGAMQVKQMEKIEELYLYILKLAEQIEELKKENNQLKKN